MKMPPLLRRYVLALALAASLGACRSAPETPPPSGTRSAIEEPSLIPTRLPDARRIVAIGDLHGDLGATIKVLRLGGLIDEKERWIGGETVVVQTGDILDRGNGECEILDLFERLTGEAAGAGGAFHHLLGNHEFMNVSGNFRYIVPGAFLSFRQRGDASPNPLRIASFPKVQRGRASAMLPGGWVAKNFERRNVVLMVGKNVFVHAGLLLEHAEYGIERINREARAWVAGEVEELPQILEHRDAPIWTRKYSGDENPDEEACAVLSKALSLVKGTRMMVGHTVQEQGINAACGGEVWRIDVGMSAHYGGPVQVLEILDGKPTVLREAAAAE